MKDHKVDLLVLAQEITGEAFQIPSLYLSAIQRDEENMIYRYQCGDRLAEEIAFHFRRLVPDSRTRETEVYMVYSPLGRCGKTALALEVTRQLPGSLYIGMETYNSLNITGGALSQLLYSIMQKEESVLDELKELRSPYHGSYIVASSLSYYDLRVLDYEHLSWFLARLCKASEYSAIILDVDAGVFDSMELLRCGDRLLVPVLRGDKENIKLRSMERAMRAWGYQELYERMELIEMPDLHIQRGEFQRFVKELLG